MPDRDVRFEEGHGPRSRPARSGCPREQGRQVTPAAGCRTRRASGLTAFGEEDGQHVRGSCGAGFSCWRAYQPGDKLAAGLQARASRRAPGPVRGTAWPSRCPWPRTRPKSPQLSPRWPATSSGSAPGVVIGSNVFNLAALLSLGAIVAGRIVLHRLWGAKTALWTLTWSFMPFAGVAAGGSRCMIYSPAWAVGRSGGGALSAGRCQFGGDGRTPAVLRGAGGREASC